MATFRELIYIVLDQVKAISDDRYVEEEHVLFLLKKYRLTLLEQEMKNGQDALSPANFQTGKFKFRETTAVSGLPTIGDKYIMSTTKLPHIAKFGGEDADTYFHIQRYDDLNLNKFSVPWLSENITYTNRKRFGYVGHNKYLFNILYITQGVDGYLYAISSSNSFLDLIYDDNNLVEATITTIFQDPDEVATDTDEDILDTTFPIDDKLVPKLIEHCLRFILGMAYRPRDDKNNANDDLSTIASFIRQNMKSNFNKLLDGTDESELY